jgi:hypothetical protein
MREYGVIRSPGLPEITFKLLNEIIYHCNNLHIKI